MTAFARLRQWLLALLGLCAVPSAAQATEAVAGSPAACSVHVIHGLHQGDGIDERLSRYRANLERAPFSAWQTFRLLNQTELNIALHATGRFTLPNGKAGALSYIGHVQTAEGKHRLKLRLEVGEAPRKQLSTLFTLDEGGVFFDAGQRFQGGLLVLCVSCSTHP